MYDDAVGLVEALDATRAYVIGGAETYDGDSYFPEWDRTNWKRVDWIEYDRFTLEQWVRSREARP